MLSSGDIFWEVVGGGSAGGVVVRAGQDLKSEQSASRLSTGALVKQLQLVGDRLEFERLSGNGPNKGWASIVLKDKVLLQITDKIPQPESTPIVEASDAADARKTNAAEADDEPEEELPLEMPEATLEGLAQAFASERQRSARLEKLLKNMEKELKDLRSRVNDTPSLWTLEDKSPKIHPTAWIAPGAAVIGKVIVEAHASVWFNCTVRADNEVITIGEGTDIQDNSILHCDAGKPLTIGKHCLVGHQVCLHGCTIGEGCLIGMRATILDNAVVGNNCFVAATTNIPEKKVIPEMQFVQGSPAKTAALETVMPGGKPMVANAYLDYVNNKNMFQQHLRPFKPPSAPS